MCPRVAVCDPPHSHLYACDDGGGKSRVPVRSRSTVECCSRSGRAAATIPHIYSLSFSRRSQTAAAIRSRRRYICETRNTPGRRSCSVAEAHANSIALEFRASRIYPNYRVTADGVSATAAPFTAPTACVFGVRVLRWEIEKRRRAHLCAAALVDAIRRVACYRHVKIV